jgi:transposase
MGMLEKISQDQERRRERDRRIVAARESGQSYAAIGREFGLSAGNVKDRIKRYFREQQKAASDDPFVKLSSRTLKILQREGLMTADRVFRLYRRNELLCLHGFGTKSLREIEKWFHPLPG